MCLEWNDGLKVLTLEDCNPSLDPKAPIKFPPVPRLLTIRKYSCCAGWETVCSTMPPTVEELVVDQGFSRCLATVMSHPFVPEEAERGEYFVVSLSGAGEQTPRQITTGAGRVCGGSLLSPDGKTAVFTANYSESRPITTCCDIVRPRPAAARRPPLPALTHRYLPPAAARPSPAAKKKSGRSTSRPRLRSPGV